MSRRQAHKGLLMRKGMQHLKGEEQRRERGCEEVDGFHRPQAPSTSCFAHSPHRRQQFSRFAKTKCVPISTITMARHLTMSTQAECPWRCKSHSTRRSLNVTQAAVQSQPASQHLTTIDRRNLVLGVAATWCTSSAAHAAPTVFEKLIITCDAGQQLTVAARAVAEWDLCVALPTAGPAACASDARSSALRRQAAPLNRVIPILREDLPRLATNAMKRGPPKNVLGLLQNPEVNEFTWPYNVNSLRDQTDAALQELQTSAYEVLTDKAAATDPDKLNVFASSIKSARELYAKMLSA